MLSRTVAARSHRNLVPRITRMSEDRWLFVDEIAEHLGVVKASVYRKTPHLVRTQNPAARLDHTKREILAARSFEIPAEAVLQASLREERNA